MLQPPANKILFEVFLNCCQSLNDSQGQRYVCTESVFELKESFSIFYFFAVFVHTVYLCERWRGRKGEGNEKKKVYW